MTKAYDLRVASKVEELEKRIANLQTCLDSNTVERNGILYEQGILKEKLHEWRNVAARRAVAK